jgi:hypothetical protein
LYLFALTNGKKKLTTGKSPADALEIPSMRLTPEEMAQIIRDDYVKIDQRQLLQYVHLLG